MTLYTTLPSPLGELLLVGDERALRGLWMQDGERPVRVGADWVRADTVFEAARTQLAEYFGGARRRFELELEPAGTPFAVRVWGALVQIPYGTTITYGELAAAIGRPHSARGVGAVNALNPISIVIPCHRLVGADGGLTGYAGGIERKHALLQLEARAPAQPGAIR